MNISASLKKQLLVYQQNEITEYHIYRRLANTQKSGQNRDILFDIAEDEVKHAEQWQEYTRQKMKPNRLKVLFYVIVAKLLGITFSIKLMERSEENAQKNYARLRDKVDGVDAIIEDENDHEDELIGLLDEERLYYAGSMVLGLNDALVELTGALAGLTLALQNTVLIALTGSITGIAAALSMGASEYLSTKSEETGKIPLRASLYTGTAYLTTVVLLILPYLIFSNYYICLAFTLAIAVLIIAFFNYYISVAKDESFKHRFWEMAILSLSVAAFSFFVGFLVRRVFGVET